jgi:exodeoxyribonuclease-3
MKIITWNVNGLRAIIKKGFREFVLAESPDIVCLQEVKARPEQLPEKDREIPGYTAYWNPSVRPGYSGVLIYTRAQPNAFRFGIENPLFDVEGRVIQFTLDRFELFNVYFPSGQRGMDRVGYKLDFYRAFLDVCKKYHAAGRPVIVGGDYNTAHAEIDLANPKSNVKTSGFLPEEREWIDHYIANGFVDAFRRIYPERIQYTWWTYRSGARERNIGWRLDYFLVSENFIDQINDVKVFDHIGGSDHCPVMIELKG